MRTRDKFQSTQPSQAVTQCIMLKAIKIKISIHTALAGCDQAVPGAWAFHCGISIHTALAGCDVYILMWLAPPSAFQSTQPSQAVTDIYMVCRPISAFQSTQPSQAVTHGRGPGDSGNRISIHTALAGCDSNNTQQKPHSNRHNHIQCIYI